MDITGYKFTLPFNLFSDPRPFLIFWIHLNATSKRQTKCSLSWQSNKLLNFIFVLSLVSWTVLRDRFREETSCSSRWTGLEEGLRSRASSWGQGLVSPECSKNQEKSHHDCSTEDTFFNTTRCPKKKCELLLLLQVVIHTFFWDTLYAGQKWLNFSVFQIVHQS